MRRTVGQQERRPRPDKHLPLRGGPSDDDFRMSSGGVGYVAAESKHGKDGLATRSPRGRSYAG